MDPQFADFVAKLNARTLSAISSAINMDSSVAGWKNHQAWIKSIMADREKKLQAEEKRLGH